MSGLFRSDLSPDLLQRAVFTLISRTTSEKHVGFINTLRLICHWSGTVILNTFTDHNMLSGLYKKEHIPVFVSNMCARRSQAFWFVGFPWGFSSCVCVSWAVEALMQIWHISYITADVLFFFPMQMPRWACCQAPAVREALGRDALLGFCTVWYRALPKLETSAIHASLAHSRHCFMAYTSAAFSAWQGGWWEALSSLLLQGAECCF